MQESVGPDLSGKASVWAMENWLLNRIG
jgi:hypothetical protein